MSTAPGDSSLFSNTGNGEYLRFCWDLAVLRLNCLIIQRLKSDKTAFIYNAFILSYNTLYNVYLQVLFLGALCLSLSFIIKKKEIYTQRKAKTGGRHLQQSYPLVSFCSNKKMCFQQFLLEVCCMLICLLIKHLIEIRRQFQRYNKKIPLPLFCSVNSWSCSHG